MKFGIVVFPLLFVLMSNAYALAPTSKVRPAEESKVSTLTPDTADGLSEERIRRATALIERWKRLPVPSREIAFVREALVQIGPAAAYSLVKWLIDSRDRYMHSHFSKGVVEVLERIGLPDQVTGAMLIELVENDSLPSQVKRWALTMLGERKEGKAVVPLIETDWSLYPDWESAVQEALLKIGEPAIEPLINAPGLDDFRKRVVVQGVLSRMGESAVDPLIKALGHSDWLVRRRVEDTLVQIGQPALDRLIKALEHEDSNVRSHAASALRRLDWEPTNPREIVIYTLVVRNWNRLLKVDQENRDSAINEVAQTLIRRGDIADFEYLLFTSGVGERIDFNKLPDYPINEITQTLILQGRWKHTFKSLLSIKSLKERPEIKERLLRLAIGCWVKTWYPHYEDWNKLDALIQEEIASFPRLSKAYTDLKLDIEERFRSIHQDREIIQADSGFPLEGDEVTFGADMDPMLNVLHGGASEIPLVVTRRLDLFTKQLEIWEEMNNILLERGFLQRGTYDGVHLLFGIPKKHEKSLMELKGPLMKLVSLLSFVYNSRGRNYYIYTNLRGRDKIRDRDRIVEFSSRQGTHTQIQGPYHYLLQIRAFTLITRLKNNDFLSALADYLRTLIMLPPKKQKTFLKEDIRYLEGLMQHVIREVLGVETSSEDDSWLVGVIERLKANPGDPFFVVSQKERRALLQAITARFRARVDEVKRQQLQSLSVEVLDRKIGQAI